MQNAKIFARFGRGSLLALLLILGLLGACHGQTLPPDTALASVQRTPGGVRYLVHERGTGPVPVAGNRVAVRYTGFLPDGRIFDATKPTGGPLRFRVGRGEVIPGWDELLLLLPAGTKVRAWIPAPLAYGTQGITDPTNDNHYVIPPNTELIFELQILSKH